MSKHTKELELLMLESARYERMKFDREKFDISVQEITPPTGQTFSLKMRNPIEDTNTAENDPTLGRKFDSGKTDYSLMPLKSLKEVTDVLGIGAKKYAKNNWRYVEDRENRYWSAAMRHLISWKEGDKLDDESGKNHLAHAIASIMFLLEEDLEK